MKLVAGTTAVAALAAAVGAPSTAAAQETVSIDGSSTVYPITEAFAEEFQIDFREDYRVTVGISGTGGGLKKLCRGEVDIANASRPISESERELCRENGIEYIELPVALDALTVVVNPQNDWVDCMTVQELQTIWEPKAQGQVTSWRQARPDFPDRPLNLYGPGVDSGTYDYFTEAVVGEEGASRGDFTASEDDNVLVQGVANDPNALGFFGYAYYEENQNRLRALAIDGGDGCVEPSTEAAKTGEYQPLSRPLFIYVSKQAAEEGDAVRSFVEYYLDEELARDLVSEVGYVPLPAEAYEAAMQNFEERATGTAFAGGAQVGISIEDILQAERAQ